MARSKSYSLKKFEYLAKIYDSESSLNFELAKLGAAGWLMTGLVRWNPSPSRIQFMVWFAREMNTSGENPRQMIVGEGVQRIQGDPLGPPCDWPTFNPESNPFLDDDEDYLPTDEDDD